MTEIKDQKRWRRPVLEFQRADSISVRKGSKTINIAVKATRMLTMIAQESHH
jgi:hypothetical protein